MRQGSALDPRGDTSTGTLWIDENRLAPIPYIIDAARRHGETIRELVWMEGDGDGGPPLGRIVPIGRRDSGRDYEMDVRIISPRLLVKLLQAREDVVLVEQLNLLALYAVLSKLGRRRKIIALVEGDYGDLGKSGTAAAKVALRWLTTRFVDVFVANSEVAEDYLTSTLRVPPHKVVVGWWLAGLPPDGPADQPDEALLERREGPVFLTACALVPRKGVDLLLDAVAQYRRQEGPCTLWVAGEGPEREQLEHQARRLGIAHAVHFLGHVSHERFKGLLQVCDTFVLPTLRDLIGRVVVEAMTVGVPVVVSHGSGSVGVLVRDDVNGICVDPTDPAGFAAGLRRAVRPDVSARLRQGVKRTQGDLHPEAAARVVRRAASVARNGAG